MSLILAALAAAALLSANGGTAPLRTETIVVAPPEGWVVSHWVGGAMEVGEFTPIGQTGARYVDLLGYSILPKGVGGSPVRQEGARAFERRDRSQGCTGVESVEQQRAAGWFDVQLACVGRTGAAPGVVEIEFASTRVSSQAVYRVWRTWRGDETALSAMIKARTGLALKPVSDGKVDQAALGKAFAALAPQFWQDLARSEICDLTAARICAGLSNALPAEAQARLTRDGPFVAAFYAEGRSAFSRQQFRDAMGLQGPDDGTPNRVFALAPGDSPGWDSQEAMDRMLTAVAIGQAADGGGMAAVDAADLSDARRAELRALIVSGGRRLWQVDRPPSTVTFSLPSAP